MRRFDFVSAVCAASLILTGCAGWFGSSKDQGCKPQYQQNGRWVIEGINIPIQTSYVGTITVGKVDYSGPEIKDITETLRLLDIARLGNCSLTTSSNFHLLSPVTRDAIFMKVADSNAAIKDFAARLRGASTPAEGVAATKDAAKVVPALQSSPVPGATAPTTAIDPEARVAAAEAGAAVLVLRTQFTQLDQGLAEVRKTGAQRMKVTGFEPNGAALLAERREAMLSEFRQAIAAVPASRTPTVLFIGYADGTGLSINNADLALRRATTVAEFLRRQDFGRDFHSEVTSGGVASQASGENARRVDIVVSHIDLGTTKV